MNRQDRERSSSIEKRSPVFIDICLGVLSMGIMGIAAFLFVFGISLWPGWYILILILNCSLFIAELIRSRLLRIADVQKDHHDRMITLIIIFCTIVGCSIYLIKAIYHLQ